MVFIIGPPSGFTTYQLLPVSKSVEPHLFASQQMLFRHYFFTFSNNCSDKTAHIHRLPGCRPDHKAVSYQRLKCFLVSVMPFQGIPICPVLLPALSLFIAFQHHLKTCLQIFLESCFNTFQAFNSCFTAMDCVVVLQIFRSSQNWSKEQCLPFLHHFSCPRKGNIFLQLLWEGESCNVFLIPSLFQSSIHCQSVATFS